MPQFPPDAHVRGGQAAAPVNAALAREFYDPLLPLVAELSGQGLSLRQIARELDGRGVKTRHGFDQWSATQVRRVLARAGAVTLAAESNAQDRQQTPTPSAVRL